jgi:TDG/mug DNA glycosylase family protein
LRVNHAVAPAGARADGGASRAVRRLTDLDTELRKRSFPPVIDGHARALILGTLPGEESLRRQQYYAHPRNLFWPIIFGLFGETPPPEYAERLQFVLRHHIALWDVVAVAARLASADSTIRGEEPNPIDALLAAHPGITAVAFNGGTARRLHDRYFRRRSGVTYLPLPSTSPAHARLRLPEKLAEWSRLLEVLR